ncbi:Head-to-tail connector protein, podovirus-type [uncultured Caudovirales phage]|uniref:Head-to-tail connector protein, podovirus-type n=1 Tax=uncultured Caudovirales phage TaxID=2100421 RepID=A0A6J5KTV4_9CAUD|nr:Head-to-tail connector protein, podovirus-type [uncultured Caudovirales phage]
MSEYNGDGQSNKLSDHRDKLYTRWGALKSERASWVAHWKEISDYLLPRSGRFFIQDRDKGYRRHNNIYDSTGTRALRVLAAGMMAGMTSPARPWFRLGIADKDLMKNHAVKVWLNEVTRLMLEVFSKGNTYRALHHMYEELGAFGTSASVVMDDYNDVIRHYPLTTGEFAIATDYRGQVNTLYREFQKTVAEVVGEFGINNVSSTVKNMHDRGSLDQWVTIVHAIEPRIDRDVTKKDDKNMPYSSCYFELNGEKNQYLRESGFKVFPALCPRWTTSGGDIYGNSPGMEALGDIKQLQHEQLRKAQGIDYKTKPPLQVPTSMKNRDIETLPGGISFVDATGNTQGIQTAFEVNIDLSHLLMDIQDCRGRIEKTFYADLFLMLANQTDTRMTATEVAERHEEKLLMLGTVIERLQNELLDPLIEMTFNRMLDAGIVPPPPEELQGMSLDVEFVSMLAQAQKAVSTNGIDRFMGNLGAVAQYKPEVLDKFNADKWADIYSDVLGVDPELIKSDEDVAAIRQQRAKAQQDAQQQQQMAQGAQTAQTLSQADTSGQNGLTDVMNMFSGYNSPSSTEIK